MANHDVGVNEGASSSNENGYLLGGANSTTSIHKIAFATESLTSNLATMSFGLKRAGSASGASVGMMAGGANASDTFQTAIKSFTFSTEQAADAGTSIGSAADRLSSNVASTTNAYFSRGRSSSFTGLPAVYRVAFATGTFTDISKYNGMAYSAAGYSSGTNGYFAGGYSNDSYSNLSSIDRLVFATETYSTLSASLAVARNALVGVMSSTKGYSIGGVTGAGYSTTPVSSEIDGVTFATDAANNPSATLGTATTGHSPTMSTAKGYLFGGTSNISQTFAFGTETSGSIAATFSSTPTDSAGMQQNSVTPPLASATCDANVIKPTHTFLADASAQVSHDAVQGGLKTVDCTESASPDTAQDSNLFAIYNVSQVEGATVYGGFGWQLHGRDEFQDLAVNTARKMSFTTETMSQVGTASFFKSNTASTSGDDVGLVVGGMGYQVSSTYHNRVDAYTFATETYVNQFVFMTKAMRNLTGAGNKQYGYFAGGEEFDGTSFIQHNTMQRVAYADSALTTLSATLPSARADGDCGFSSPSNGYFNHAPSIDKMSFATETLTTVANQFTDQSLSRCASAFDDKAYVMGTALLVAGTKNVDRIGFATDTFSSLGAALSTVVSGRETENTSSLKGYAIDSGATQFVTAATETFGTTGYTTPYLGLYATGLSQKADSVSATVTQDAQHFVVFVVSRSETVEAAAISVTDFVANATTLEPANADSYQLCGKSFDVVGIGAGEALSQSDCAAKFVVEMVSQAAAGSTQVGSNLLFSTAEALASAQVTVTCDATVSVVFAAQAGAESSADAVRHYSISVVEQAHAKDDHGVGLPIDVTISELAQAIVDIVCLKDGEVFRKPVRAFVTTFAQGAFAVSKVFEFNVVSVAGKIFVNNDVGVNITHVKKKPKE